MAQWNKCLITMFLFSQLSFAQDQSGGVMANARKAIDRARDAISKYATSAGDYKDRWLKGLVDSGSSRVSGGYFGITGDAEGVKRERQYRKEIDAIRADHGKKSEQALNEANRALEEALTATSNATSAAATNVGNATVATGKAVAGAAVATGQAIKQSSEQAFNAAQHANLVRQVNNASNLTWDLNKLWGRYRDVNATMDVIERELDRSVLNAYIQEKTARLLSSDNLCTAAKSCADNNGKNKAKFSMDNMKDIFPHSGAEVRGAAGTKQVK